MKWQSVEMVAIDGTKSPDGLIRLYHETHWLYQQPTGCPFQSHQHRRTQMSDDLVKRLEEGRTQGTQLRWQVTDVHREAAARIRELEAERDEAVTQMVEAKLASEKQRALLDECEKALEKMASKKQLEPPRGAVPAMGHNQIWVNAERLLEKLRAQENADEAD